MKKFSVMLCLLVSMIAMAQYTGPGFYRVHNVYSDSYICIKGTAFKWSSNPDAFWSCIKMLPAQDGTHVSDAGSLIYIPYLEQTSLYAQGVDTYSLTDLLMDVSLASESEGGLDTYVAITRTWITMGGTDVLFPFFFRDRGMGLTVAQSESKMAHWWIEPVNEESMETSYFGVAPASEAMQDEDGFYWTTLFCDFPYMLPVEGGVEGAYTVKSVTQDEEGNYCAGAVKVYGQGEVVPAATPVLLKCKSAVASGNKVIPTGEIANNTVMPTQQDLLMGNYFSTFINHNSMSDASVMTQYVPELATMASDCYLALGVDAEGRLGFFPQEEGTYMTANTSWLTLEGLGLEGVTAVYLQEIVEPVVEPVIFGDADGDGKLSIKDVITIIDYLMSSSDRAEVKCADGADVNGDGAIRINDVTLLIDILMQMK